MNTDLKYLLFLFPVMLYYFVESALAGIFVYLAWKFVLQPTFNIEITYFQWVIIIWIIKVIFFDIFKLLASFMNTNNNPTNNTENNEIR